MQINEIPKVSVIIPTYNRKKMVRYAIESVLAQTYQDFELIIVDDGSTDGTVDFLAQYQNNKHIRLFFESHAGASSARNKGIVEARAEYIAFLDSDDIWFPNKLDRQVAFLDEHPDIALVHATVELMSTEGRVLPYETKRILNLYQEAQKRGEDYAGLSRAAVIFSSTAIFRKNCLEKIGYFDPALTSLEDLDLYLRATFQGHRIGFLEGRPVAKYCYRGNVGHSNQMNCQSYLQVFQKQIELLEHTDQIKLYKNAYLNFLSHTANFYYALNELVKCRQVSLKIVRVDPKSLFRFSILRNIFLSFATVHVVMLVRSIKEQLLMGGTK